MTVATKTAKKTTAAKPTGNYFYGVGRRKASNVRAKYYPGTDAITVVVDGKSSFSKSNHYFLGSIWC
jgi:hypothetical protein